MIEVNIRPGDIQILGHSGYAVEGKDIVCAGVSALFQTMLKSIGDLTDDKIKYDIMPGKSGMRYGNLSKVSKALIDSFIIGVIMIKDSYPEHVKVIWL